MPNSINLEAQDSASGAALAPWEALDLSPYMAPSTRDEIGFESTGNTDNTQLQPALMPRPQLAPVQVRDETAASSADMFPLENQVPNKPVARRFKVLPPTNPAYSPLHSKLFVAGFLFCPCWWYGAWRKGEDVYAEMHRFRCSAMSISSVAVIVSLLVLEAGFRNA